MNVSTRKRFFVFIVLSLALGYALLILGAYAGQSRLIYPRRGTGELPELAGAELETLASKTGRKVFASGSPIRSWRWPTRSSSWISLQKN